MSDFNLLYKKYNSISNLTNDLNNSVILLKRRILSTRDNINEKHPNIHISDDELSKAKTAIITILSALEEFYNKQEKNNELYGLIENPLFKSQILNNPEYKNQIVVILKKIKSNDNLSRKDLASIDKFIAILDNEAAVLFRKLRISRR